ncbi:hypothetical protein [Pseudomarimonas salicorniae]|uniref:HEAT repeat-containing protein n=1 Tax=Pseudomarimonas salicorniae TaxID=2933270 RepID=A0ABT0GM54_9GAMM|nr:hypothetical protein [Lysobacter sp. CAU 1642]MCK7595629.1 hypothetical protein [Lysobacter sp. CAU 1642]
MTLFTFGREHEKRCEAAYVNRSAKAHLLMNVVDSVHDLIEGKSDLEQLKAALVRAIVEGDNAVYVNAEKWLRKASAEYPSLLSIWHELAAHSNARIRARVAAALDQMPEPHAGEISEQLSNDKSKIVRSAVAAALDWRPVRARKLTTYSS